MNEIRRGARPWAHGDVVLLYGLSLLGLVLLLASAWATSSTDDLSTRVAWVNLGVIGLLVAGVGNTFWLLAGRRAVGQRRALLLAEPLPGVVELGANRQAGRPPKVVALRGATRFHRPDCVLVAGKSVTAAARSRHEQAGRRPCGVCDP